MTGSALIHGRNCNQRASVAFRKSGCHSHFSLRIIAKQRGMEAGGDLEKAPLLIHGKASGCQLTVQLLYSAPAETTMCVPQRMQLETTACC